MSCGGFAWLTCSPSSFSATHRLKPRKVKNESRNALGDTVGRIHLGRQDLSSMRVKRVKALRKSRGGEEGEEEAEVAEDGLGGESSGSEGEGVYDSDVGGEGSD